MKRTQSVNLYCPVYGPDCRVIGTVRVGPSSSDAAAINGSPSSSGGCATTARQPPLSDLALATAGAHGLAALVRARKRPPRKGKR